MKEWKISLGRPYPLGVSTEGKDVNIAVELHPISTCGMLLYHKKNGNVTKIEFGEEYRIGDIYCIKLSDFPVKDYDYNFFTDEEELVDPYVKAVAGNEIWHPYKDGYSKDKEIHLKGRFLTSHNPFTEDKPLMIPYDESIIYCLHVRGFTRHTSSKVKAKGTFKGIVEKIPYLQELGITAVELMPAYEFLEDMVEKEEATMEYALSHYMDKPQEDKVNVKFNYWGYQQGYYFAPKASYAYSQNPVLEFQTMVKEFHDHGIEVIMQFYFPNNVSASFMLEILKHWVYEYHVDGFRLKGANVPMYLIATEPMLSRTKLMYDDVPEHLIYGNKKAPAYKNIAYCSDDYSSLVRRFLKGDNDCLYQFQTLNRTVPEKIGVIRSIANYYGFRLQDLVSYEQKHNEDNGENNQDGVAYNYSWNCGAEGPTRKKNINSLRLKQMKNAMGMLLYSQGTPFLMSGDEFCQTQNGNNNPYNQDNEISWLNWKWNAKQKEFLEYTKDLIAFRRAHKVLHKADTINVTDKYQCGYPEISYHTEELWKVDYADYRHHIGCLYTEQEGKDICFTYILYNMHWNEHAFALPNVKNSDGWRVVSTTDDGKDAMKEGAVLPNDTDLVMVGERSVMVLQAVSKPPKKRTVKKQ